MPMNEHKYMKLAQMMRENILSGVYSNGSRLPGENELVKSTGYSRQTVRQAMSILEKEGLTKRVQGSGTYVHHDVAHREQTYNIAVITTYINEYIFPAVLSGIAQVLSENGYTSMLAATSNHVGNERKVLTGFLSKPIDGLIVEGTKSATPNPNIDLYEHFTRQHIPVVFINGYYPNLNAPVYVVADDRAGGKTACDLLLKKGHQRIAGIFKIDDIQGGLRYEGYARALINAGLPVEDDNVLWYDTDNREIVLNARLEQVLDGCSAAVCYNDEVTMRMIEILQKAGHKPLPDIASFDKSTLAHFSAVPFASLENPKEELGRLAARKLLRILQGKTENSSVMPWKLES